MAKTIPQLTDATTVNAADELIIQQGGITKRATAAEVISQSPVAVRWNDRAWRAYPDTNAAAIHRLKDRLFIGDGADFTGNFNGTQGGFVPTATQGASWASRDSTLFVAQDKGFISVTGFAGNANRIRTEYLATIGVAGFAINSQTGPGAGSFAVWAMYADVQLDSGVVPGSYGHGLEIAAKNNATDRSSNPYLKHGGVVGIWLAGGGDPSYGGAGANPCNSGIDFIKNGHTWNRGIVFHDTSLTGCDGVTGTGSAILMAKGHQVEWWASGVTSSVFYIRSDMTGGAGVQRILAQNGAISMGTDTANRLRISGAASDVNGIQIFAQATGQAPSISPAGPDTNINLLLVGKGTGTVAFGTHASVTTETVTGFITIKDSGGNTRKIAVVS